MTRSHPSPSLGHVRLGVLLAAGELVALGLLASAPQTMEADLLVDERGFRYLPRFWTSTGVLELAEDGLRARIGTPEELASARLRVAAEWVRAGAPATWARAEATAALATVLGCSLPPWPES